MDKKEYFVDLIDDWDVNINDEDKDTDVESTLKVELSTNEELETNPEPEYLSALHRLFGHQEFRPMQWKIISSILKHKRDNCAVMSTGYGKSLCFQFPSAFSQGVTFVISPLISLMEDQILSLTVANIPACLLGTANNQKGQTYNEIRQNKYRMVYLTPEFCNGDLGQELLKEWSQTLPITLIAIDEAHCVSSWGQDFRHSYRKLGNLRDLMPDVPILAVTATATENVRKDIIKSLKLRNPLISSTSFDRPNFYFAVHEKIGPEYDFKKVLEHCGTNKWKFSGPTIVYCITRKKTVEISGILEAMGVKCAPYHAGLGLKIRKETHENFVKDQIDVVVATIAFGMGIDKPDVRNVIHYGVSDSIEAYYQEVGRAGRDGQFANCISFYDDDDFRILKFLREKSCKSAYNIERKERMFEHVQNYLATNQCRRQFLLNYFQENLDTSNRDMCCDNCKNVRMQKTRGEIYLDLDENGKYNFSTDARLLLTVIETMESKFGLMTYIHFLRGSKQKKLANYIGMPFHGAGKGKKEKWWKELGAILTKHKLLTQSTSAYNKFAVLVEITDAGRTFLINLDKQLIETPTKSMFSCLKTKDNIWQSKDSDIVCNVPSTSTQMFLGDNQEETPEQLENRMRIYSLLYNKRAIIASKENCMPYMIISNKALMQMAKLKPKNLKEMEKMHFDGFTTTKLSKFGKDFLDVLISNQDKLPIAQHLKKSPLSEATQISSSALSTFRLFQTGKTIQEIAEDRSFSPSTIESHLNSCLRNGYEMKVSYFGINENVAEKIIEGIFKTGTGFTLLNPVKMACPDDISFGQIKALMSYLEIREHLTTKNLIYDEFDDPIYYEMYKSRFKLTEDDKKLDQLLNEFKELEEYDLDSDSSLDNLLTNTCVKLEASLNQVIDDTIINSDEEPVKKKSKTDDFYKLLESPPRADSQVNKNEDTHDLKKNIETKNTSDTKTDKGKNINHLTDLKKKCNDNLPAWLTKKRRV